MVRRAVLFLLCVSATVTAFGLFSRPNPFSREGLKPPTRKQGALKLCPPGGASFSDAFNLICPMRRRRRSAELEEPKGAEPSFARERRSSLMARTMQQCCISGCDFADIMPLCNPFN